MSLGFYCRAGCPIGLRTSECCATSAPRLDALFSESFRSKLGVPIVLKDRTAESQQPEQRLRPSDRSRCARAHVHTCGENEETTARVSPYSVNWNVVPGPSFGAAQSRPPCCSTIDRLIDRPIPI